MPTAASTPHAIPVTNLIAQLPARYFGKPPGTYTKTSPERSVGKTCDLAFGYMGGLGAWRKFEPEQFTDRGSRDVQERVASRASEDQAFLVRR